MPAYELIVALGSSFAAGPGIPPVANASAMRSANNYASKLAGKLGARLVDLTVSGATTANILDTPQQTMDGATFAPQLDGVPPDAEVVTITAGGNDLQFFPAMLRMAWIRHDPASPVVAMIGQGLPDGVPVASQQDIAKASSGLVAIVERVRTKAPDARILLVDYLTVLDKDSAAVTPFSADEVTRFLALQEAIGLVFTRARTESGAELIRASWLSVDHALGSAEPWVQPFHAAMTRTASSFHPNELGMSAIAVQAERVLSA
jgi:lysophospholipase L1-like esterase